MVLGEKAATDMIKGKDTATSGSTTIADHADEPARENSSTAVQAEEISKSTTDPDGPKKLSVLIVDDCPFNRLLHNFLVTQMGLESHLAENGRIAVDLHHFGASFDLILMDMEMPVMNGVEATKQLRAMGVDTVIVGVTANDHGPERQAFVEAGLNDCLTKPLSDEKNIAVLVQVVKGNNERSK